MTWVLSLQVKCVFKKIEKEEGWSLKSSSSISVLRVHLRPPPEAPALEEGLGEQNRAAQEVWAGAEPMSIASRLKDTAQVSLAGWVLPGGGREHTDPSALCLMNQKVTLCIESSQMGPSPPQDRGSQHGSHSNSGLEWSSGLSRAPQSKLRKVLHGRQTISMEEGAKVFMPCP